jgi:integrase
MPFDQVPTFLASLRARDGVAAKALEFLILTAARTNEVVGATWDKIDLATKTWTIPAHRIKGGREHRIPLSDRAIEILRSVPTEDGNAFVFIGPRSPHLSATAMAAVLQRMGHRADATVHGFRSSFRDWAAEKTKHANIVVEQALAHAIGKVEAAYRRGDLFIKRRTLMAEWERYCLSKPADVLPMKARRKA